MVAHNSPRTVTLTRAGGYAPAGSNVGVVTVTNLTTGATSRTASLGTGITTGAPVRINTGHDFEISNTDRVFKAECDTFIYRTFRVGVLSQSNGAWLLETRGGHNCDCAELFALPWPYHAPVQPDERRPGSASTRRPSPRKRVVTGRPRGPGGGCSTGVCARRWTSFRCLRL